MPTVGLEPGGSRRIKREFPEIEIVYAQIARRLHLSERTVKRYMKEILARLHLKSRAEAEAYARRRGL